MNTKRPWHAVIQNLICVAGELATVGTFVVAAYAYFYTVVPIYQKEKVEEEKARVELELAGVRNRFASELKAYVQMMVLRDAIDEALRQVDTLGPFYRGSRPETDYTYSTVLAALKNERLDPDAFLAEAVAGIAPGDVGSTVSLGEVQGAAAQVLQDFRQKRLATRKISPDLAAWATQFVADIATARSRCKAAVKEHHLAPADERECIDRVGLYIHSMYERQWDGIRMEVISRIAGASGQEHPTEPPDTHVDDLLLSGPMAPWSWTQSPK